MRFRITYYNWVGIPATVIVSAKSFAEARETFYKRHGINIMYIDSVEKL